MLDQVTDTDQRIAASRRQSHDAVVPTGRQIAAARALLRWSIAELARRAGISPRTVARAEASDGVPRMHIDTLEKIKSALETGGIEFIHNANGGLGVRLRRRPS
jgi:transcriptional regulator with XRE-family HTH domain